MLNEKTQIALTNGRPLNEADCRLDEDIQTRHLIVNFKGRHHAIGLADWLDNYGLLRGSVCCVEFEGTREESRIDLQVVEMPTQRIQPKHRGDNFKQYIQYVQNAVELYAMKKAWAVEVEDLTLEA